MRVTPLPVAVSVGLLVLLATGCGSPASRAITRPSPTPSPTSPSSSVHALRCLRSDLHGRFVGGGLGTGNDFGSIVIWNAGMHACRVAGAVAFGARFADGRPDRRAVVNRPLPPVDVVLPGPLPAFRDGQDPRGYLVASLMGPERDDPGRPDGLCRQQDKLAPAWLDLNIGTLRFAVTNNDPGSPQGTQVYGCHGQVLLESIDFAPR